MTYMLNIMRDMHREHLYKVELQKEAQAISETLSSDKTLFVSAWADYDRDDVVTLWVATCLSAGVNPNHKAAHSKDFAERMVAIGSAADDCIKKLNEVIRRYKNVSIHANNPNSSLNTADELRTKIELSAFRKWVATEKDWKLPKGFPGAPALLAGPDQPNVATPSPAPEHPAASVVTDKAGLPPLTTGNIAFCFAGLRWKTESEWKKPLGDKPKWLTACIAIPGARGVNQTRWNPVLIGAALVRDGYAKPNSIRAKFQTVDLLKPWLDEWNTYEADNLATE